MCITLRRTTNLSILLLVVVLSGTSPGWSQTFQVIYNFGGPGNPVAEASPLTAMTLDDQGNLFGTTSEGGFRYSPCPFGCGTVFELSPNGSGGWNERVVYVINGYDGGGNPTAQLVLDPLGNLYGTVTCFEDCTAFGGSIFKLTPSDGSWTESTVYGYQDSYDNGCFASGVVLCPVAFNKGHLFGSTPYSGMTGPDCDFGCGTVFTFGQQSALQPPYYLLAYAFNDGTDGRFPEGQLAFDSSGNIYGTTEAGGATDHGTVYMLTPNHNTEGWSETVLYSFRGGTTDGTNPAAGVVLDAEGNIYGVTLEGGTAGHGTVFKLTRQSNGTWSETLLYSFQGRNDADDPNSTLAFDAAGNLYGTAAGGSDGQGTLFKLTPSSGGQWTESLLHTFTGGLDGELPYGGVTIDGAGNMYGTASTGGVYNSCQYPTVCGGVAYQITP